MSCPDFEELTATIWPFQAGWCVRYDKGFCLGIGGKCKWGGRRMVPIKKIMGWVTQLEGLPYRFGTEQDGREADEITAEDCSEMVQNACDENGVIPRMPDGAIYQYRHCKKYNTLIPVAQGIETYGALLFRIGGETNHVAFSLGNGKTFEARGRAYGVGSWSAEGRGWTHAALIPGVDYKET